MEPGSVATSSVRTENSAVLLLLDREPPKTETSKFQKNKLLDQERGATELTRVRFLVAA